MDPKSRDSQGRAVSGGKAIFAATLAALLAAGCDAGSLPSTDAETDVTSDDTAQEESAATADRGAARRTPGVRVLRPRAMVGTAAPASDADLADAAAAPPVDDGATGSAPGGGSVAPVDAGDDLQDEAPADGGLPGGDVDPADDDTSGEEPSDVDPAGDVCADGADVTPPAAVGRVVTIAADETGMEPISPGDCVEVVDDCDENPIVELIWAASDEPETGVAVDDRSPDVTDLGCGLGVRAERAAGGDGRVYTVGFRAVDRSGNATEGTCSILVEAVSGVVPVDSGALDETELLGPGCP